MTKSISRSQVRLIASTNAIFGADEACAMLRISRDAMYRLAPPCAHRQHMLLGYWWLIKLPPSAGGVPRLFFYPFH